MAFNVEQFVKQKTAQQTPKAFDVESFVRQKTIQPKTTFDVSKFVGQKTTTPISSAQLKTEQGLLTAAEQAGVGERAEKIIAQKGEDPKKIFSGGFISDTFDALNLLQHGVTGTLQGKGFMEGIKTRASFSEKESLGKFGVVGTIGGIALDIAVDPLTYIAPVTAIKKIPGLVKGAKVVKEATKATEVGQKIGRAFVYRFGQDPIYKQMDERRIKVIGAGVENLIELVRPITKLDTATQRVIADARKAGKLDDLASEVLIKAKPAFDALDDLGKQAVEAGLLKPETYQENVGRYIARLYRKFEAPTGMVEKVPFGAEKKPLRLDLSRFKKRTDIPEEVREAMGEILEAGYPTAKALVQLKNAVENTKFFNVVSQKFSKDIVEEGFTKLPETARLGGLSGKAVPRPIADSINEIIRVRTPAEKVLGKVVAGFKFGKVILNPSTHARNIMSNFILNDFEGLSPARLDIYTKAARQIAKKGDLYQEAKRAGLGIDTFAAQEIKDFIASNASEARKLSSSVKKAMNKAADLYQKEEEFAKMAQYIFQREKGLSPEQALEVAERATFNYAQVTPFVRRMRESIFGFPFITFTYKVTPQITKTLLTKPGKISKIGKAKVAIENQAELTELQRERTSEPQWVRDGFYVKLPVKDKQGRSAYLDLTYILPFGDLISGQFLERGISRETGLKESLPSAVLQKTPFLNLVKELSKNQDFFGNRILKESDSLDQQLKDIMRHITKTYAPPLISDQIPGGYNAKGERQIRGLRKIIQQKVGEPTLGGFQGRNIQQELLRLVGLKINPVDVNVQEGFAERERIKALQTLLQEKGVTDELGIPFVRK